MPFSLRATFLKSAVSKSVLPGRKKFTFGEKTPPAGSEYCFPVGFAAVPIEPAYGVAKQLLLNQWVKVFGALRIGSQVSTMRAPSPPPVMLGLPVTDNP